MILTWALQCPESQASNRYSLLEIITQQVNWLRKGNCSCLNPCLHLMWNPQATDISLLRQQLTTVENFPKKVLWLNLVMWWLRTWGLKRWRGCWKKGSPPTLLVGKLSWHCHCRKQKTKNRITIWSSEPTPGHISRQNYNSKKYMHPYFIAALVTIARRW